LKEEERCPSDLDRSGCDAATRPWFGARGLASLLFALVGVVVLASTRAWHTD
jgi:hypothetical protein